VCVGRARLRKPPATRPARGLRITRGRRGALEVFTVSRFANWRTRDTRPDPWPALHVSRRAGDVDRLAASVRLMSEIISGVALPPRRAGGRTRTAAAGSVISVAMSASFCSQAGGGERPGRTAVRVEVLAAPRCQHSSSRPTASCMPKRARVSHRRPLEAATLAGDSSPADDADPSPPLR